MIGVTGILKSLPITFPLSFAENSGNMIHGDVPFRMFRESYLAIDRSWPGYNEGDRFKDFVNDSCTHVVITCANMFRANDFGPNIRKRYLKLEEMLSGYKKPVILFGLGVQAAEQDLSKVDFPPEAISAMHAISEKAHSVSVRGEFTKSVLAKYTNVDNVFVTGCPSFFSAPESFAQLQANLSQLKSTDSPRFSFSGTHFNKEHEQRLLLKAIQGNGFLIEPQNKDNYIFHLGSLDNPELVPVPDHFRNLLTGPRPELSRTELVEFFSNRFKMFRDIKPWDEFNREFIDFTFGTRFHVNMSSILSGKPALWLTHDSRTRELAQTLNLPSLEIEEASSMDMREIIEKTDYSALFDNLDTMFGKFNDFLRHSDLPTVALPRVS